MTKRVRLIVYILIALFGWNFPVTLHVAQGQSPTYVPDEVIVKYRDSVDEFKKEIGRFRVAGQRKRQFKLVRGLEVIKLGRNVSVAEAIDLLKQDPDVLYAEPNYRIFLTDNPKINLTPNDPSMGSLWGLTKINAPGAWNNSTGSANVAVGILDTGFDYTHGDLSANIFNNPAECVANGADNDGNGYEDDCHGIDVVNGDTDPIDDNGHGTHVAGTIGAVGNNGTGVVGVNWNVKMLSCKVFDANGSGSTDDAVLCLEYFEFMKVNRGVNIIATNNSWGGGDYSQALYDAIDAQREAGILFIAAAGNGNEFGIGQNNDSIPLYPCNYFVANMICVAATTSNDGKASFSNFGRRTVHVGAPGQNILSTVPGGYSSSNGTSMATPHVTGLAALLKAQDSNRDWRAIKNLILAGGNTVNSMSNTITGRRINALGSMTCSNTAIQTRLQPIATTISASPGVPVVLASLNINCANPNGNVSVSVSSGGTVTLLDDGANGDQAAGDGIYSALWTPSATGTYTLTFPGNDRVTVNVANPTISVSPSSLNFGNVSVGQSADKTFTVTNSGGGILAGTATTSAPYSIVSGETYNLSGGQSQTVTVRFSPTTLNTFASNVTFTGGAGASPTVTGVGTPPPSISASPSSVGLGGTVTATWSSIATPSATDWIALYVLGAADDALISFRYTTGAASGSVPYTIPSSVAPGTYELRLFANGTWTRLAKSNSFTVTAPPPPAPASLSVSPNSVGQGGTVTATWSSIATPSATDWIALYVLGAADNAQISFRYTTGAASGSVPYTIPSSVAPGTYELRLFANGTWTRLATSNSFTVTAPPPPPPASLSVSPNNVGQGGTVTATWSGIATPSATDWIALYVPGAGDSALISFRYTTGTASGSVPFTLPGSAGPGTYELRLFANGTYTRIGISNSFTVTPPAQASLSVTPTSIGLGGTVTATWSGIATPSATDWIALYVPGAGDSALISFRYTTGTASGSVPFTLPGSAGPGTYELRLFANGTYTRIGISNSFTVTPPAQASLSVTPTSIGQGGTVTATWSGIATPSATDWIALYVPGAGDTALISFRYTTGTASGSVPFTLPGSAGPGTYELRLFVNGTYTRIGISNSFTVTPP